MKAVNILLSILLFVALFCFILTFAIAVPIYFRPFYYSQIDSLNLQEESELSKEQIKEAYDDVMNYLTGNKPFAVGDLWYSQQGKQHFQDVKIMFNVNLAVLIVSFVICVTIFTLDRLKIIQLQSSYGKYPWFFTGVVGLVIVALVAVLSLIDFSSLFELFHQLLFFEKADWTFNPVEDPIILILPEKFFFNCAILVGVLMIVGFVSCIAVHFVQKYMKKRQKSKQKNTSQTKPEQQ